MPLGAISQRGGHQQGEDLNADGDTEDAVVHLVNLTRVGEDVEFPRGDCNGDGVVTGSVTDASFLLRFNFVGAEEPPCLAACDAKGDGAVTGSVTDADQIVRFNFLDDSPLVSPFPQCGVGTEKDEVLGCETPPEACR